MGDLMNVNLAETAKDFCEEFYSVEKVIEVWPKSESAPAAIRLEAVVGHHTDLPTYGVRAYAQWKPPQPSDRMIGAAWVKYNIPAILTAESVDQALRQALSFLWDRFRQ